MTKLNPPSIPPEQNNQENQSKTVAIPLGKHWMAIVHEDGSIILQYLSSVPICGSEVVLNLMEKIDPKTLDALGEIEDERFAVRTLFLLQDGSVASDQDAISPKGLPTEETFFVFPPMIQSVPNYFKRRTGKGFW